MNASPTKSSVITQAPDATPSLVWIRLHAPQENDPNELRACGYPKDNAIGLDLLSDILRRETGLLPSKINLIGNLHLAGGYLSCEPLSPRQIASQVLTVLKQFELHAVAQISLWDESELVLRIVHSGELFSGPQNASIEVLNSELSELKATVKKVSLIAYFLSVKLKSGGSNSDTTPPSHAP